MTDFPTSIINLKPTETDGNISPLIVFIPGNPGIVSYYHTALTQLHEQLPQYEILGISHAGMSPQHHHFITNRLYTMEEQIQHKVEIINEYLAEPRDVLIMGHSVGAYMVQKIVTGGDVSRNANFKLCGLLTPTVVDIHKSEKGMKLTKALGYVSSIPELVSAFAKWTFGTFVPKMATTKLVELLGFDDPGCQDATRALLTRDDFVLQALGLAREEMQIIRDNWEEQEKLVETCASNGSKIWLFFAKNDHWVSNETRNELIEFYSPKNNTTCETLEELKHSFVVGQNDIFVKHAIDVIRK